MVSVLISFLVKSGMCIQYPSSNKIRPRPPVNDTSWQNPTYPNCTNYTATYTGLSSQTFSDNIYGLCNSFLWFFCTRFLFFVILGFNWPAMNWCTVPVMSTKNPWHSLAWFCQKCWRSSYGQLATILIHVCAVDDGR